MSMMMGRESWERQVSKFSPSLGFLGAGKPRKLKIRNIYRTNVIGMLGMGTEETKWIRGSV